MKQSTSEVLSSYMYKLPTFEGTELQDPSDTVLVNGMTFRRSIQPFNQYGISDSVYSFPAPIQVLPSLTEKVSVVQDSIPFENKYVRPPSVKLPKALPVVNHKPPETYVNFEQVMGVIRNHIRSGLVVSWSLDKWWLHLKMLFGLNETDLNTKATILGCIQALSDNSSSSPNKSTSSSPTGPSKIISVTDGNGECSSQSLFKGSEKMDELGPSTNDNFAAPLHNEYECINSPVIETACRSSESKILDQEEVTFSMSPYMSNPISLSNDDGRFKHKTKQTASPFISNLYFVLNSTTFNEIISWSESGKSFIVFDKIYFIRDVMPHILKYCDNFDLFELELLKYGFVKSMEIRDINANAFFHQLFQKDKHELLLEISLMTVINDNEPEDFHTGISSKTAHQDQDKPHTNLLEIPTSRKRLFEEVDPT